MFEINDPLPRRALRFVLGFQLVEIIPLGVLAAFGQTTVVLVLSLLTLVLGLAVLLFSYILYSGDPRVAEKRALLKQKHALESAIKAEQHRLFAAQQRRIDLTRAQQTEVASALEGLRRQHIEEGLRETLVLDADISGVGPILKERLIARGIVTAANVDSRALSGIEGFGDIKRAAILRWRDGTAEYFEASKPNALPSEAAAQIEAKYHSQHTANDELESQAKADKEGLEGHLETHLPKLEPFASYTFKNFVTSALAGGGPSGDRLAGALLGSAVLLYGVGIISLVTSGPRAAPGPAIDYEVIGTAALETAMASQFEALTATAPTATTTSIPLPTETATMTPEPVAFPGIAGADCIPDNPPETGKVIAIVDGDTIRVLLDRDGKIYSLRYIGVDTPEMTPLGQTFAREANARNIELTLQKSVTLVKDVSETDQFGRLLRYVIVDNLFINYELVEGGFAQADDDSPDTACDATFDAAEQRAVVAGLGYWGAAPTLLPLSTASRFGGGLSSCDCHGIDMDCDDFGSHASAQACYDSCFATGFGDVFRLDGSDNDGLVCENLP